mgnify:CR=1 FL=1
MLTLVTSITLLSCSSGEEKHNFTLNGTWVLEEIQRWEGDSYTFDQEDKTWLRIYDNTCYYECQVVAAPSGMMFVPYNMEHYTLIERGPNDYLYLQESNTHPLTVESGSTIVIQETGNKYRWKVCDSYDARKVAKIVDIIRVDMENPGEGGPPLPLLIRRARTGDHQPHAHLLTRLHRPGCNGNPQLCLSPI